MAVAELQQEVDDLARQAVETLKAYFGETEPDKHDEIRAKVASSVFGTVARIKQTQGAREALGWQIAALIMDKEQLQDYVRVSMPNSPLVKALPEKMT